jgi:isoquinoline 1-oxidoreductase beta subunit
MNPAFSRRRFLQGSGLTFTFAVAGLVGCGEAVNGPGGKQIANVAFNAYVMIAPDGKVTIINPAAEMGQGVMTALAVIVAEELDVAWDDVHIESSPPFGEIYGDPLFSNKIFTTSSRTITNYYARLRQFGRQARRTLLEAAAEIWQEPVAELSTEPSKVIHRRSNRFMSYGEIAAFARITDVLPDMPAGEFKEPANYRLVGKSVPRRDVPEKIDGSARYSIDAAPEGLLYAAVSRAPIEGATVKAVDIRGARNAKGVVDVVERETSVAVVAENFPAALRAREQLRVEWHEVGEVNRFDSERAMARHIAGARDATIEAFPWDVAGDVESGFAGAERIVEREYQTDYVYHAQIEPLNAVVAVSEDGRKAEVWAGTQAPANTVDAVARTLGMNAKDIKLNRSLLGGGFGRRTVPSMDFVVDSAWLSQRLKRPVKVIWTREDDLRSGHFKPMTAHYLRAGVDGDGNVSAWHHRVASEESIKLLDRPSFEAFGELPVTSMLGAAHHAIDRSPGAAYDLPNRQVEHVNFDTGIRTYPVRGVGATPNNLAIESFIDELAGAADSDPIAFRLQLLHRSDRARKVVETVADMADWPRHREGRALGLAYTHYVDTVAAAVAEVSVARAKIRVHHVWVAADVGLAIQPDNVRAQLEGGVIHGIGYALSERITIKNGIVEQSNFHDYSIVKMADSPVIVVELIDSPYPPTGVGETGAIIAPAAVGNAFAALTGRRLRRLPFIESRVQSVLEQV